jgi:hypothetical protein
MTAYEPGAKMIHEPTGRKCFIVNYSRVMNESNDYVPHVQVQFEGVPYTSFVKEHELKEFLLG